MVFNKTINIKIFVEYFAGKADLTLLGLSGNNLTCLPQFGSMLDSLRVLELNYMNQNSFDVERFGLTDFIRSTSALHELYLRANRLNEDSITQLIQSLEQNSTIRTLHLNATELSRDSIDAIIGFLFGARHLQRLSLEDNNTLESQVDRFLRVFESNLVLHDLKLFNRYDWEPAAKRQRKVDVYNVRNWCGYRRLPLHTPPALWPHVIARAHDKSRVQAAYGNYEAKKLDPVLFANATYRLLRKRMIVGG